MQKEVRYISDSWSQFDLFLLEIIISSRVKTIIEIGGGANPALSKDLVVRYNLEYTVQDLSKEELCKAEGDYFIKLSAPLNSIQSKYDLIISKMVLEHIEDPDTFHQGIKNLMQPNAIVIHFFATLYNVASIANLIFPDRLTAILQKKITPRELHQHDKFPAYYRRCKGPTIAQIKFFQSSGYDVEKYIGYSGHNYFWKYKWIYKLEKSFSKLLVKSGSPHFCSNAIVLLRKSY
jgi:hypothetical protein